MKIKKVNYVVLVFALLLVGLVFIFTTIIEIKLNPPVRQTSLSPAPLPTLVELHTVPPIRYDAAAENRLLQKSVNKEPLSETDKTAKSEILSLLPSGKSSGSIYNSANVRIDYIYAPDIFQAEIYSVDIAKAKKEAVEWFTAQGMSPTGICDLPVMFYLNWQVANVLQKTDIVFNPLPEHC